MGRPRKTEGRAKAALCCLPVTSVGLVEALPARRPGVRTSHGANREPPTLARRFPVVPGARLYPLVPPLPVQSSLKPDHLLSAVPGAYALQADERVRSPPRDRQERTRLRHRDRELEATVERQRDARRAPDPPAVPPSRPRAGRRPRARCPRPGAHPRRAAAGRVRTALRSRPSPRQGRRGRRASCVPRSVSNASPSTSSAHSSRPASAMFTRQASHFAGSRSSESTARRAPARRREPDRRVRRASRRSRAPRSRPARRRARTGSGPSSARPDATASPRGRRPRARPGLPSRGVQAQRALAFVEHQSSSDVHDHDAIRAPRPG